MRGLAMSVKRRQGRQTAGGVGLSEADGPADEEASRDGVELLSVESDGSHGMQTVELGTVSHPPAVSSIE